MIRYVEPYPGGEWLRRLRARDEQAIHALIVMLTSFSVMYCARDGLDPLTVDDIASEAQRRILRAVENNTIKDPALFSNFCRVVLANVVKREVTKKRPESLDDKNPDVLPVPGYDDTPVRIQEALGPCLDQLATKYEREYKACLMLYFDQYSVREIAQTLNVSENYANRINWNAREHLRECLEKRGYHTPADIR